MGIQLRPYQEEAVAAIEAAWADGINAPACVMATGLGKTTVFSALIGRHYEQLRKEGKRILVIAHRGELLEQAEARIKLQNPGIWTAVVKGNRGQKTHQFADVVIASAQTLARPKRRALIDRIGMVIVDECHVAASQGFRDILTHYGCIGDGTTPTVGFTATLTRMSGGLPDVWQAVAYEKKIAWAIHNGFLVKPVAHVVTVPGLNLSTTRVTAGDLNSKDVANALEESAAFSVIADQYKQICADRAGVVFMPNVATAHKQAEALRNVGITSEAIDGGMGVEARNAVYGRYNNGATQVIVNCNVLIEGWDAPHTSAVVIGRPTLNPGNFIQQVGRGLRLHPGKDDCIVMDLSGASHRHSLAGVNDLESDCEAQCNCNCLSCGCNGRCKCKIRNCGCRCIEQHESATGCRCQGTDECPCLCQEETCGVDTDCTNDAGCGCKGEGEPREQKEVDASQLTEMTVMDIVGEELDKSSYQWSKTYGGIPFLPIGQTSNVFIIPDPAGGGFFQGLVQQRGSKAPITRLDSGPLPADQAREALEAYAATTGYTYNVRKASWRRTPPNAQQLKLVETFKIRLPEGKVTKGMVSDAISVHVASNTLDSRLAAKYIKGV